MPSKTPILLAALLLGCAIASAQSTSTPQRPGAPTQGQQGQQGQGQGGQEPRRPPAEALAACKSLASGAKCSFTAPHGVMAGTCFAPEGRPLACRPSGAPGGPRPAGAAEKPTS